MRKVLLALLTAWILAVAVTPTIIITHSTPRFFQLSKDKMAIVIDEDENQAVKALVQTTQTQPIENNAYYTTRTIVNSDSSSMGS